MYVLDAWEKCQSVKCSKETKMMYKQKSVFTDNIGEKIFPKVKKIKQNLTRLEKFDICFCVIFDNYSQWPYSILRFS